LKKKKKKRAGQVTTRKRAEANAK